MSLYFGEDFGSVTIDLFGALRQDTRRRLRDLLRDKGVYVERRGEVLTRDALYAAAQEELQWPVDDTDRGGNIATPISDQADKQEGGHNNETKEETELETKIENRRKN